MHIFLIDAYKLWPQDQMFHLFGLRWHIHPLKTMKNQTSPYVVMLGVDITLSDAWVSWFLTCLYNGSSLDLNYSTWNEVANLIALSCKNVTFVMFKVGRLNCFDTSFREDMKDKIILAKVQENEGHTCPLNSIW